jgi:hypothetical protein
MPHKVHTVFASPRPAQAISANTVALQAAHRKFLIIARRNNIDFVRTRRRGRQAYNAYSSGAQTRGNRSERNQFLPPIQQ